MKLFDVLSIGGNVFTYILATLQSNEILQIISFTLSILTSIVILLAKILAWWKEAKKDGKIDSEELNQLADILKDTEKEIKKKGEENGKN